MPEKKAAARVAPRNRLTTNAHKYLFNTTRAGSGASHGTEVMIGQCRLGRRGSAHGSSSDAPQRNPLNNFRLAELERIMVDRVQSLPEAEGQAQFRLLLTEMLPYLAQIVANEQSFHNLIYDICCRHCPAMIEDGEGWIGDYDLKTCRAKRWKDAPTLGQAIKLDLETRTRLKIKTIREFDRAARQRKADKKRKKAEYQREYRLLKGAKPRSKSLTALKPWEKEGISRSKWYARRNAENARSEKRAEMRSIVYLDKFVPINPGGVIVSVTKVSSTLFSTDKIEVLKLPNGLRLPIVFFDVPADPGRNVDEFMRRYRAYLGECPPGGGQRAKPLGVSPCSK